MRKSHHHLSQRWTVVPLPKKIILLNAWEGEYDLLWHGQPPICRYCRKEGHIKYKCPVLAKQECYECGAKGHTRARCPQPVTEQSESNQLDAYIQMSSQREPASLPEPREEVALVEIPPTTEPGELDQESDEIMNTMDTEMIESDFDESPADEEPNVVTPSRTLSTPDNLHQAIDQITPKESTENMTIATPARRNPSRQAKTKQMAMMANTTSRKTSRGVSRAKA